MSIAAMSWVWKQALPPTEKFILLALADHANDEDYTCWPSLKHLTRKTGFSRPTIWKTIDRLIALGIVMRVGESATGSTRYQVLIGNAPTQGNALTQITRLPNIGDNVNQVGKHGNNLGNGVTSNHKEPSITITESSGAMGSASFARSPCHGGEHEIYPPVDNSAPARVRRAYAQREYTRRQTQAASIDEKPERID